MKEDFAKWLLSVCTSMTLIKKINYAKITLKVSAQKDQIANSYT
jgi:hypothetical protein